VVEVAPDWGADRMVPSDIPTDSSFAEQHSNSPNAPIPSSVHNTIAAIVPLDRELPLLDNPLLDVGANVGVGV
jgi:hypothetical protein